MDLGKVRRVKVIFFYLVKCIVGEVVIVRDFDVGEGIKRYFFRIISVSGSIVKDIVIIGKDGIRDYIEIDFIFLLLLYVLFVVD